MYIYAQKVFGMTPEKHQRHFHDLIEKKNEMIILSITIEEAKGLEAKSLNGNKVV